MADRRRGGRSGPPRTGASRTRREESMEPVGSLTAYHESGAPAGQCYYGESIRFVVDTRDQTRIRSCDWFLDTQPFNPVIIRAEPDTEVMWRTTAADLGEHAVGVYVTYMQSGT